MELKFETKQYDDFSVITSPLGALIYVVTGSERALVIDGGHGLGRLRPAVDALTELPKTMVLTHGHPDHGGAAAEFAEVWLHPADFPVYRRMCTAQYRWGELEGRLRQEGEDAARLSEEVQPIKDEIKPMAEGQRFDLGGRVLEAVHIPGHTKGSMAFLDRDHGLLFAGDMIGDGAILMHLEDSLPMTVFAASMRKLQALKPGLRMILPGHNSIPLAPDKIDEKLQYAQALIDGKAEGVPCHHPLGDGYALKIEHGQIIYDPNRLTEYR